MALTIVAPGVMAAAPPVSGTEIGQRLPQFSAQLVEVGGAAPRTEAFDSHANPRLTAYVFVGTRCPATAAYAQRFRDLEQTYEPKGVRFIYVYPNRDDTSEAKRTFHKDKQFRGAMIDDQGAQLARLFKAQRTTEIFLVDKEGTVLFHGGFDDNRNDAEAAKQHFLAAAIDEHLAGKPVTAPRSQVFA
jgi:peroxiredoxin